MPEDMAGGLRCWWSETGQGPERALMIHCSLAHSGVWAGLAERLGDLLTMRAFDLPGHGKSGDWDGVSHYQTVARDMALDLMDADAPMHLIGHSFGGTVALRIAVEQPQRVKSLVLIEPVCFGAAFLDDPDARDRVAAQRPEYTAALAAGEFETAARWFVEDWGVGRKWDELRPGQRAEMVRKMPMISGIRDVNYGDAGGILRPGALDGIAAPVLLIEGAGSPAIIDKTNAALARRIPACDRSVIPGASHMAPITHPAETAAEIRAFLTRRAPA